jgi:Zn ribbon nucleic-acid-binding protein
MGEEMEKVPAHACVKCGGEMEFGLMVDAQGDAAERSAQWVRGRPDTTAWLQRFKASGTDRIEVKTLRCVQCGFLEMYAR